MQRLILSRRQLGFHLAQFQAQLLVENCAWTWVSALHITLQTSRDERMPILPDIKKSLILEIAPVFFINTSLLSRTNSGCIPYMEAVYCILNQGSRDIEALVLYLKAGERSNSITQICCLETQLGSWKASPFRIVFWSDRQIGCLLEIVNWEVLKEDEDCKIASTVLLCR